MMTETRTPLAEAIEDLAASRGFSDFGELAEAVDEETGEDYTAEELENDPRAGFGNHLSAVLHLSDEEKRRLVRAFMGTFMRA
jgi:hypothetical protein